MNKKSSRDLDRRQASLNIQVIIHGEEALSPGFSVLGPAPVLLTPLFTSGGLRGVRVDKRHGNEHVLETGGPKSKTMVPGAAFFFVRNGRALGRGVFLTGGCSETGSIL